MTQSFDEWMNKKTPYGNVSIRQAYNAGAKSRQAEVDTWVNDHSKVCDDFFDCQGERDELKAQLILQGQRFNDQSQKVSDLEFDNKLMQKRIDKALIQISNHYHSCIARKNLKRMSASVSEIAEIEVHESSMCVLENILKGKEND